MTNTRTPVLCALFVLLMLIFTNSITVNTSIPSTMADRNPDVEDVADIHIEDNNDVEIAQSATRIYNGVQESGYLTGTEDYDVYYIIVGSGAISMRAVLDGSFDDDFDLYGRYGSSPSTDVYDWRGFSGDADEDVTHENPSSGTWYIMVHSFDGSGTFYLTVTIEYSTTFTSETTTPPETTTEPPPPNGYIPLSPAVILGVAGVGVVLVVAVIAFMYIRRRGADSGPEPFEVVFPDSY
ncbi:MAG: PPC domain-containing protein [Candidatus Thorarchaeota archaeon]